MNRPKKTYSKWDIVDSVQRRSDGAAPKLQISDVIDVIFDFIKSEIKDNRVVTIENFGIFMPIYKNDSYKATFIPHFVVKKLAKEMIETEATQVALNDKKSS